MSGIKGKTGVYKHHIHQGFQKGCTSWLKGKKGYINSGQFKKGDKGYKYWKGKHFSEEHINKLRKPHNKISYLTTENKRIRTSTEYRLWREAVFARDNWTCQKCNKRGGELHPHHIFNFSTYLELRFAIDNGITLCKRCHKEFHKIYGTRNNTKEQLINFLS